MFTLEAKHVFQVLQFLIFEHKYTFQSCIFDLHIVKSLKYWHLIIFKHENIFCLFTRLQSLKL